MVKDWKVVIDDTGGSCNGWPCVSSEEEDRTILHVYGFQHEYWNGPSLHEAKEIAQIVANFMNSQ